MCHVAFHMCTLACVCTATTMPLESIVCQTACGACMYVRAYVGVSTVCVCVCACVPACMHVCTISY